MLLKLREEIVIFIRTAITKNKAVEKIGRLAIELKIIKNSSKIDESIKANKKDWKESPKSELLSIFSYEKLSNNQPKKTKEFALADALIQSLTKNFLQEKIKI